MDLSGVIPPLVTPVDDRSGSINIDALEELTKSLLVNGVHGLFPCGTTGEFTSLSQEERKTVINTVVDVADSTPVLAGCGGTGRDKVGALIEDATDAGADAAVVVTPYFLPGSQGGLEDFYLEIAETSKLPILLYHIPQRTGQKLHTETVKRLSAHPNIIGIKDSSGDSRFINELIQATPDSFSVYQGGMINGPTVLSMGIDGIVPGETNFAPAQVVEFYEAYTDQDIETAISAFQKVNQISRPFMDTPLIPAIKFLTGCAGYQAGPPLPPFSELDAETKAHLEDKYTSVISSN